jgi:hypothetical protein
MYEGFIILSRSVGDVEKKLNNRMQRVIEQVRNADLSTGKPIFVQLWSRKKSKIQLTI